MRVRLTEAEKKLADLRQDLTKLKQALREFYVKAGRDESRLTPQAIFADGVKEKLKPDQLLALADQIEEVKVEIVDLQMRVDAQRRRVSSLWEQVNEVPRASSKPLGRLFLDSGDSAVGLSEPPSANAVAAAASSRDFACDLYGRLATGDANLFFSPYSISAAMAMTYAGARGETEKQMAKVLHFDLLPFRLHPAFRELAAQINGPDKPGRGVQLSVTNALWGQQGCPFKKEFLDLTSANYGAGLQTVDFKGNADAARQTINSWIEKQTQGKITGLLASGTLNELTRLVLTNAVYFKGRWAAPFKKAETRKEPFTLCTGRKVDVQMMQQEGDFGTMNGKGFQGLRLDYAGQEFSMFIVLPNEADGLPALAKSLTSQNLEDWISSTTSKTVKVFLPRFTMTRQVDLVDTLKSMGLTDAFVLPPADFSGMTDDKSLFLSAIVHRAFVEVNEEGTEAAAATAPGLFAQGLDTPKVISFRADHPFLFLIRHNATGTILFLGRMMNPTE